MQEPQDSLVYSRAIYRKAAAECSSPPHLPASSLLKINPSAFTSICYLFFLVLQGTGEYKTSAVIFHLSTAGKRKKCLCSSWFYRGIRFPHFCEQFTLVYDLPLATLQLSLRKGSQRNLLCCKRVSCFYREMEKFILLLQCTKTSFTVV